MSRQKNEVDDTALNAWLISLWTFIGFMVMVAIANQLKEYSPKKFGERCEKMGGDPYAVYKNPHLCLLKDGRIIDLRNTKH